MHQGIRDKAHIVMRRHGLFQDEPVWRPHIHQVTHRAYIWSHDAVNIFGRALSEAYCAPARITPPSPVEAFAFGYSLGYRCCRMQGGEESGSHHAGILGGILIAFSGIFDWACDIETRDRHRLVELVNEETLDRAFDVHARPYVERSLRAKSSDPVVVQVICALIDTFIARCDLLRRHHDDAVWVELRHTVLTSYHAQMGTLSEIFQVGPGPLAYNILFDKGALLTWVVALTSALMVPDARLLELDRLRPAMFEFGKAVWLADDLVDIEDDLANGMWNYVVLELDKEMNILRLSAGERPDPDRTFAQAIDLGVIDRVAVEMSESYLQALAMMEELGGQAGAFRRETLPWINSHFF